MKFIQPLSRQEFIKKVTSNSVRMKIIRKVERSRTARRTAERKVWHRWSSLRWVPTTKSVEKGSIPRLRKRLRHVFPERNIVQHDVNHFGQLVIGQWIHDAKNQFKHACDTFLDSRTSFDIFNAVDLASQDNGLVAFAMVIYCKMGCIRFCRISGDLC